MRFVEDPPYIKNAKPGRLDASASGLLAVWLGALQIILDKGQEDDWFGATWIRWAPLFWWLRFVLFLVRELTHDKPLVDLRIFRNRNFLMGCVLIVLFGGVVYGLITFCRCSIRSCWATRRWRRDGRWRLAASARSGSCR